MSEVRIRVSRVRPGHHETRRSTLLRSMVEQFVSGGFLHLSVDDMARYARCSKSSLYVLGSSKEQIILAVVRAFFREATDWIAGRLDNSLSPEDQIGEYLRLIAQALSPASVQFFRDVDAYAPARDVYQQNTRIASDYVRALVHEAVGNRSPIDALFVGTVAGLVMNAIQRNVIEESTGLDDVAAYRALADLIVAGVRGEGHLD
jgi:AcrR family transcriptional regulator